MYEINHIHLRSSTPRETADWYVKAFNFEVVRDWVRPIGDRFVRCRSAGGLMVNISGPRTGEVLAPATTETYLGLEHFGVTVDKLEPEIERLRELGAQLVGEPAVVDTGVRVCFLIVPGDVRIELMEVFDV
ncbi:VOC family protein [Devosia faecipullorum]|uniref:VOC family protein n=1 Tax=Devosia faecipullorum TaxID=2755039 RepID=UPI00187B1FC4|nr:VOC family protein [Devosia faecipullorum]MBE7732848.1 VOC family protein [Devosia faecipullorum]